MHLNVNFLCCLSLSVQSIVTLHSCSSFSMHFSVILLCLSFSDITTGSDLRPRRSKLGQTSKSYGITGLRWHYKESMSWFKVCLKIVSLSFSQWELSTRKQNIILFSESYFKKAYHGFQPFAMVFLSVMKQLSFTP